MDDVVKIFSFVLAMGLSGTAVYALVAVTSVLVRRLEGRRGGTVPEALEAELAELRARLDESDQVRARVAELEERLDFAERLLAQQRDAERLGPGGH